MLDEGTTDDINGIIGAVEKTFSVKFSETKKKVWLSSYLFVNEIYKFKADNKNVNFPTQFCLGSMCVIK